MSSIKQQTLFLILPKLDDLGPAKGATAIAKGLSQFFHVRLISLKGGNPWTLKNPNIQYEELSNLSFWKKKKYIEEQANKAAKEEGRKAPVLSICLSADVLNYFLRGPLYRMSSIRGDLYKCYRWDFGRIGFLIAWFQYQFVKRLDHTIAMSETMKKQLEKMGYKKVSVVYNFVDEDYLKAFKVSPPPKHRAKRFLFLGRLREIKRPDLIINTFKEFKDKDFEVTFAGDGHLKNELQELARNNGISDRVHFLGHIYPPYQVIQEHDYLIIPSISEGISRAMLEALYFNVPVITRKVAANHELINGANGQLFIDDQHLQGVVKEIFETGDIKRENLLPPIFAQEENINRLRDLIYESR